MTIEEAAAAMSGVVIDVPVDAIGITGVKVRVTVDARALRAQVARALRNVRGVSYDGALRVEIGGAPRRKAVPR